MQSKAGREERPRACVSGRENNYLLQLLQETMTVIVFNTVTAAEAEALRTDALSYGNSGGHFTSEVTIRCCCAIITKASGKAHCRRCSQLILKGCVNVEFLFDPRAMEQTDDSPYGRWSPRKGVLHLKEEECDG